MRILLPGYMTPILLSHHKSGGYKQLMKNFLTSKINFKHYYNKY